ncbi:DUF4825 domain-containing protein [Heyndrickxia oleronia]|uniref:DUF4825 domain-containing protein n=1 Tax=Heyndrickxia oleronia TaxID=38875 RepID=UPI0020425DBD|nr:DUF4825 domain-containing protein [Heyndrickxia oleronia]MCM3237372.1 DUF4825 domain-containing protein [Heyndrickxia oleronia]
MKQRIKFLFFLSLVVVLLIGCSTNKDHEGIFQFKDSYVGDNSAVGNIVKQLQSGDSLKEIELKTKEKPYGMILNYNWLESEQKYKETVINNATYLFALVKNVDWISFHFNNREYKITKEEIQTWYGKNLSEVKNEDDLRKLIQKYLKEEPKVNELFQ